MRKLFNSSLFVLSRCLTLLLVLKGSPFVLFTMLDVFLLKVLGSLLYDKDEESWKITLRKLEASQDNGSLQVSNYIAAGEYLPRRQIELEQYVREDEEEHSASYHMLL